MKRIFKIVYAASLFLMIPFSLITGQDRKSEQKIKIVVDDGSGTKVLIDTLISNSPEADSIKLNNGTVIYLEHSGNEANVKYHGHKNHYTVTASNDGKEGDNEVTVIASDSDQLNKDGGNMVYYYNNSGSHGKKGTMRYKVISRDSKEPGKKGEVIYINKEKSGDDMFDMYVSDNDTIEKSRYVIAKDGMVVTIEGKDEAKTRELVKEIENKLGVNREGTQKKENLKIEPKNKAKK
jgi:hypothetical protein